MTVSDPVLCPITLDVDHEKPGSEELRGEDKEEFVHNLLRITLKGWPKVVITGHTCGIPHHTDLFRVVWWWSTWGACLHQMDH